MSTPSIKLKINPFRLYEFGLQFTNKCNLKCKHCGFRSGPNGKTGPSLKWCLEFVNQLSNNNFSKLMITGGEPFLRMEDLLQLLSNATDKGLKTEVTTNGYWGTTKESASTILKRLVDSGLSALTISVDKIHQEHVPGDSLLNIVNILKDYSFPIGLKIYGIQGLYNNKELTEKILKLSEGNCDVFTQPIFPIGRAIDNQKSLKLIRCALSKRDENPCHVILYPFIDANLNWYLCSNGSVPSKKNPLIIGKLRNPSDLSKMLKKHIASKLFRGLRVIGPIGLLTALNANNGIGEKFVSVCELCMNRLCSPKLEDARNNLFRNSDYLTTIAEVEEALRCSLKEF